MIHELEMKGLLMCDLFLLLQDHVSQALDSWGMNHATLSLRAVTLLTINTEIKLYQRQMAHR